MDSRKKEREAQREIAAKGRGKRKRSRDDDDDIKVVGERRSATMSASSSPLTKRSSRDGSRTVKGGQLPTPRITPVKNELGASRTQAIHIEDGESEDGSDAEDLFVGQRKGEGDPFASDNDRNDRKLQLARAQNEQFVKDEPPRYVSFSAIPTDVVDLTMDSDDTCTIFVGDEKTPFQVSDVLHNMKAACIRSLGLACADIGLVGADNKDREY